MSAGEYRLEATSPRLRCESEGGRGLSAEYVTLTLGISLGECPLVCDVPLPYFGPQITSRMPIDHLIPTHTSIRIYRPCMGVAGHGIRRRIALTDIDLREF